MNSVTSGITTPFEFEAKALNKFIDEGHPIISRAVFRPNDYNSESVFQLFDDIPKSFFAGSEALKLHPYFGKPQFGIPIHAAQDFRLLTVLSSINSELGNRMVVMHARRLARIDMMAGGKSIEVQEAFNSHRPLRDEELSPIELEHYRKKEIRLVDLVNQYRTPLDQKNSKKGLIRVGRYMNEAVTSKKDLGGTPLGLTYSAKAGDGQDGLFIQGAGYLHSNYRLFVKALSSGAFRRKMIAAIQCAEIADH